MKGQGRYSLLAWALIFAVTAGCTAVGRHEFVTTLFDGYPEQPPPEEFCKDFTEKQQRRAVAPGAEVQKAENMESRHAPYQEKRCDDCHNKEKEDGLVKPRRELCFMCHVDFIKGSQVHGPVAVADCLACHLPHSSNFPSLLKKSRSEICSTCHREKRLTVSLHQKVTTKGLVCVDCHDPHFGNLRYFLK